MTARSEELMSQTEVAARLGLSARTVQRYVKIGKLHALRIGTTPVFRWSEVVTSLGLNDTPPAA